MGMEPILLQDRPAQNVARLLINRADKRNAIDATVRADLRQSLSELEQDRECRAVVVGGVGGNFSAGGDLPSMVGISEQEARERMADVHATCLAVSRFSKPVVAAMDGFAIGAGAGLAMLCDHVVAGPGSKMRFPFLGLGLAPDWGTVYTIPARVGVGRARVLFTRGDMIAGRELLDIGLADQFDESGDVLAAAVAQAEKLAALSAAAFAAMKSRLNQPSHSLEAELARELEDQARLLTGEDFKEGYDALANKRDPHFR